MLVHRNWKSQAFGLPTVADHLGPFADPGFLKAVTSHRPGQRLEIVEDTDGLLALEWRDHTASMAGHPSVTDYHSPRGERAADLVAEWWRQQRPGAGLIWDSLPQKADEVITRGLEEAGGEPHIEQTEVAAVLHLPATFDDYLMMVGKKERHEIRRKTRRYQRDLGEAKLRTQYIPAGEFEEFVRLHRLAAGAKGQFMDEQTTRFFKDLAELEGWRVDLLEVGEGRASACVFGYADRNGYYLYNSSFDPAYSALSPGVVLLSSLIKKAISDGLTRFDFLKGNETYKRRLGAVHRPLYTVRCRK